MQHEDTMIFVPHVKYLKLCCQWHRRKNQVLPSDFFPGILIYH